jgi:hypothetical protein
VTGGNVKCKLYFRPPEYEKGEESAEKYPSKYPPLLKGF